LHYTPPSVAEATYGGQGPLQVCGNCLHAFGFAGRFLLSVPILSRNCFCVNATL